MADLLAGLPSSPGVTHQTFPAVVAGVDLTSTEEVTRAVERFGERYLRRVFTPREIKDCRARTAAITARSLAARFAAKEATFKVLRLRDVRPPWTDVEVQRSSTGSCTICLTGSARQLAAAQGVDHIAVSLTHEGPMAAAIVVATCHRGLS